MKQVYVTKQGLHWASNGSMVRGAFLFLRTEISNGRGSRTILSRSTMRDVEVEIVPCPKNICKKCGAKQ